MLQLELLWRAISSRNDTVQHPSWAKGQRASLACSTKAPGTQRPKAESTAELGNPMIAYRRPNPLKPRPHNPELGTTNWKNEVQRRNSHRNRGSLHALIGNESAEIRLPGGSERDRAVGEELEAARDALIGRRSLATSAMPSTQSSPAAFGVRAGDSKLVGIYLFRHAPAIFFRPKRRALERRRFGSFCRFAHFAINGHGLSSRALQVLRTPDPLQRST